MSYLQTIKADAIKVWHSHRILPSICGAQASLESGSGTSKLSKPPYNNHFGIKAGTDWTGRTVSMLTGEHVNGGRIEIYADFRAYDSIYDSIADYAAFFTSTPWRKENYKHVVGETDYKKAANALRAAGYATDPQYPTKLIRIIENNNLQSWDREALASSAGSAPSTQTTATKYDSSKSSNATAINTSGWNQAEVDQFLMNAVDPPYINGAYINRFLTAYYPDSPLIGEGDTIKTMADYYGISVGAAMGVWAKETTFGREHPGLVDHNYGCIKWTSGSVYPSVTYDGTQWNKYPSKKVGIAAWFHLLRYNYIELGYHRYDSFLNRYSPTGDGNVHATFKNIMWGALKSFGYDTSETSTKYNHSKPSDNPSTVKPPASIGSGGTVVDATSKPINKRVGGQFTDAVAAYVKTNGATWIGDSLLVGTEPFAKKYSPVSNFDGLGSRQISHATPSLNATQVIRNMLNAGTLKDIIIFIIGTNRGVTKAEVDTVMSIIGSNRKIIFVSTASEVNHSAGVQGEYYGASENYSNAFFANWNQEARAKRSVYYTPDGAGGKYIHMTPTGYEAHAKYLLAAFYEVANADHSQDVAVEQKPEFLSIEDYELTEDGIITYYENTKQVTGSDGKVTLMPEKKTYDTGIKGFYSPKDDKFVYNPDANNRWGHAVDAGNPSWIDTIYTNESTNSAIEMIEGAIQELINRSEPASQYTVSLLDVDETLSIGDTGVFIDHNFNPPLYIEARVLSISTSMTDIASNTIVIGNVVELVQKENPAITALKAELQAAREEVKQEMQNSNPIVANIVSTNGLVLGDAYKETQLSIILLQGSKNVTDQFSRFEWERVSSDAASDEAFNRLLEVEKSNTIKVFNRDIKNNQSIFIARAYNESGDAFFQAETKLNYSDTALWTDTNTPPSDAKDGATWVDENGKHWIKKDGEWEERVDQAQISIVRGEVEGAIQEAEQAKKDAVKAYEDAVAEAKRSADEADATIRAEIEQEINTVGAELATAKQEAIDASNKALADAKAHAEEEDARIKQEIKLEVDGAIEIAEQAKADVVMKANQAYEDAVAEADRLAEIRDNGITIEAGQITAGVIDAARLDAKLIVTSGLSANVIKSTHIETNTATIDKLFANDAMINQLTSKTAFINSIKAVEIDAGKITSGTISTARLDASDIVTKGLTADVIKSTHIQANELLVDKVFSNQASIDRLWAKSIWANKITAMELNAGQIKAGTIDTARLNASEIVTKGLTADVVTSTHIKASEALIDNIFGDTAYINKLTSKTAFINNIKAIEISADKISGGTISGSTFKTTDTNGFSLELANGRLKFNRAILTMGTIEATLDGATGQPNGYAVIQRPGYIFSINSLKNDGTLTSFPVIQIPANSTGENRKLNLNGDVTHAGGSFKIGGTLLPAYSYQSTPLLSEGGLRLAVDKSADGTRIYYLQAFTSAGAWVNSGFAWYEDGRIARVKNGVWTQF